MSALHTILHFTWCLPQTLLGLIIRGCGYEVRDEYRHAILFGVKWLKHGLFSLGRYIFMPEGYYTVVIDQEETIILDHELGHSRQSLLLGWLYIPVIAIPSVCWFYLHKWAKLKCSYYWFYTERWANRIAGTDLK